MFLIATLDYEESITVILKWKLLTEQFSVHFLYHVLFIQQHTLFIFLYYYI